MRLRGIGVSPGIAVGPALIVEREAIPVLRLLLPAEAIEGEVARLERAVAASREQLQAIKQRLSSELGRPHAYIFDAHLLMLEDPLLLDRSFAVIREQRVNAEWALRSVGEQLHAQFDEFSDAYLRERGSDLDDVLGRILLNLAGAADAPSLRRLPGSFVLVAADLTPSDAATLDWERVQAVALDAGSATYHTAILARSFGVPAVVGLQEATRRIPPGAQVVVDGMRGELAVEPSGAVLAGFRATQERDRQEEQRLLGMHDLPAVTGDGVEVRLFANIELPDEALAARAHGALGIGLFRSEYLLGRARSWPSEERQYEAYRRLLEQMHPLPVTVRTWDIGGDEVAPGGPSAPNPALGERALRLLRRAPEAFRQQLRALLRAAAHGPLRIMFPFVSGPSDLRSALDFLDETRRGLLVEGLPHGEDVQVGVNIELPSAALTADFLAAEVDFLSIGTNDLVQYTMAVDRVDPRVADLYQPLHPAVLRLIRSVVESAAPHAVPVAVCGEMAVDPLQALLLVGLGVRELSLAPGAIPRIKAAIRGQRESDLRRVARDCLGMRTSASVEQLLREALSLHSHDPAAAP